MLSALCESAKELYASNTVTNYLFPTVAGIWLALFTANLIYVRDVKARVSMELFGVMLKFMEAKMTCQAEAERAVIDPFAPLVLLGDDLRRRGFVAIDFAMQKAMRGISSDLTRIYEEVFTSMNLTFPLPLRARWLVASDIERKRISLPEPFFQEFRQRGARLLASRVVKDAESVYAVKVEWFALFEIPSVGRYVGRANLSYIAFCEHCETGEPMRAIKARLQNEQK